MGSCCSLTLYELWKQGATSLYQGHPQTSVLINKLLKGPGTILHLTFTHGIYVFKAKEFILWKEQAGIVHAIFKKCPNVIKTSKISENGTCGFQFNFREKRNAFGYVVKDATVTQLIIAGDYATYRSGPAYSNNGRNQTTYYWSRSVSLSF